MDLCRARRRPSQDTCATCRQIGLKATVHLFFALFSSLERLLCGVGAKGNANFLPKVTSDLVARRASEQKRRIGSHAVRDPLSCLPVLPSKSFESSKPVPSDKKELNLNMRSIASHTL